MPSIHLTTFIKAPLALIFNLSRNVTIYRKALDGRKEELKASASGILIQQGDTLTLVAKHLGKQRFSVSRITEMVVNEKFIEEQVQGDLKSFKHEHHFKEVENGTLIIDLVEMEEPRDLIGGIIGKMFMEKYFETIINKRNALVKYYAESDKWRAIME